MTDQELRDAAVAALKQTTVSYPEWVKRRDAGRYPDLLATKWGQAFDLLGKIGAAPPPPPPPPPPPTGVAQLGLVPNGGFPGAYGNMAKSLKPRWIREDHLSDALVQWAKDNGVGVMGLLGDTPSMATVDRYPTIGLWESSNEPYFHGVDVNAWARTTRDFGKAFKAKYPNKRLIFPCVVQTNGGDYNGPQGWRPWVSYVFDAAPDIGQYFDGWGAHPYSPSRNGPPAGCFPTLDKVRGQLVARGFNKPCFVTEIGWSVGTAGDQVSAATQAQNLTAFVTEARKRAWIEHIYWYSLRTWGSGFEASFGVFNQDGTERPAAAAFRGLV